MHRFSRVVRWLTLIAALTGAAVQAQDKAAYERRSVERLVETFTRLDTDHKGILSRKEVEGNVEFTAIFNDIDINRDGFVTKAELDRFLMQRFGRTSPN